MSFAANFLAMLKGNIAAQLIALALSPALTRLFAPEAFGLQSLFMGVVGALGVIACCRLDLAVVLPEEDDEANRVAAVALGVCGLVCAILVIVLALASSRIAALSGHPELRLWLYLLPVMTALLVLYQLGVAFATRERAFRKIASGGLANQLAYSLSCVALGWAGGWSQSLVIGKTLGQVAGLACVFRALASHVPIMIASLSLATAKAVARRYWKFFCFNTPYSLLSTLSRDTPILLLSAASHLALAGFYGFARTIMMAPCLLLSNSLSQVFYRESVALKGSARLESLTGALLTSGLIVSAPLFAALAVWGDVWFGLVFGAKWAVAGQVAMLLAPAAWMSVQTGWPERLFEVFSRQGLSFSVQITADILTALVFGLALLLTRDPMLSTALFAACNLLYHHAYLFAIYRTAGFCMHSLVKSLAVGWVAFLGTAALAALARYTLGAGLIIGMLVALLAAGCAVALAWRARRNHARLGTP